MANYKRQCYRNIQRERKVCLFCGKRLPVYCLARDWPEPIYDDRHESPQGAR
jgi:hypothetical protein